MAQLPKAIEAFARRWCTLLQLLGLRALRAAARMTAQAKAKIPAPMASLTFELTLSQP